MADETLVETQGQCAPSISGSEGTNVIPASVPADKLDKDAAYLGLNDKDTAKYKADYLKRVKRFAQLIGGKLADYAQAGEDCRMDMIWQKTHLDESVRRQNPNVPPSKTAWTDADHDRYCSNFGDDVRRETGVDDTAIVRRVSDCVRVAVFVREASKIVPGGKDVVMELPFSLYQKFLVPAALSYCKIDIDGKIRDSWADFVKTWIPKLVAFGRKGSDFEGETDRRAHLEAAISAHKASLQQAKDANKTTEQLAQEKAAKDLRDKNKVHDAASKRLNETLCDVLGTKLTPDEVMGTLATVAEALKVDLGQSGMAVAKIDTAKDVRLICQALFSQGRYDLLAELAVTASKMAEAAKAAGLCAA